MGLFTTSPEYQKIDPKTVRVWQYFPTPDEYAHGIFVVYDKDRDVHDGRYIVLRRERGEKQVTHLAHVIEKIWSRRIAVFAASLLRIPVSLEVGQEGGEGKVAPERSWVARAAVAVSSGNLLTCLTKYATIILRGRH